MARKVKDTPTLSGKDAVRFDRAIKENRTKKVDQSKYVRAKTVFNRVAKSSGLAKV